MAVYGITKESLTIQRVRPFGNFFSQKKVTIAGGQGVLKPGTVLGVNESDFKYYVLDPAANDGTQTARAILREEVDTSAGDVQAVVYLAGVYAEDDIVFADVPVVGENVETGDGTATTFTLSRPPVASGSEKIYLDGVLQTGGYTIDYATGSITFNSAPGAGVVITADYDHQLTDTEKKTAILQLQDRGIILA